MGICVTCICRIVCHLHLYLYFTGWESVQRHHHEHWQFVEELMDVWSAAANQGQVDENYINVGSHQISESDADDFELAK